jgi:hypothetical protein
MERSFAGFWRDGAKVMPSEKHWSDCKCIFAIQKHDNSLDICLRKYDEWDRVYWLDTTTPTELTPQEAFECYKTVYPDAKGISKTTHGYTVQLGNGEPIINWGDTTEYPPKKKWRVPTDADKGKRCRYWDNGEDVYTDGTFYTTTMDGRYLVFDDDDYLPWDYCEVLDE